MSAKNHYTKVTRSSDPSAMFRSVFQEVPMDNYIAERHDMFQSRVYGRREEMDYQFQNTREYYQNDAVIAMVNERRADMALIENDRVSAIEAKFNQILGDPYAIEVTDNIPSRFTKELIMSHPKIAELHKDETIAGFGIPVEDRSYIYDNVMSGYSDSDEESPIYVDGSPLEEYELDDTIEAMELWDTTLATIAKGNDPTPKDKMNKEIDNLND